MNKNMMPETLHG